MKNIKKTSSITHKESQAIHKVSRIDCHDFSNKKSRNDFTSVISNFSVISSNNEKSTLAPKPKSKSKSYLLSWIPFFKGMTKSEGMTKTLLKTKNQKLKTTFGFTLVELIVVITILAILGTIAFISFGSYSSSARDGTRISDLANISKGLEMYQLKVGSYPIPEGTILTGTINGIDVVYKGVIGDNISRNIGMSKTPLDPLDKTTRYIYGINYDKTKYQVASILENSTAYNNQLDNLISTPVFAAGEVAGVKGNYNQIIKFSTGSTTRYWYIANVPSLVFNFSGTVVGSGVDLMANKNNVYFVVNKNTNLPYSTNGITNINSKTPDAIIQEITNTGTTYFTGVDITSIVNTTDNTARNTAIESIFGTGITSESIALLNSFNIDPTNISNTQITDTLTTIITGTSTSTSTSDDTPPSPPVTPTYSCTGTLFTTNADITNTTGLTADTPYQTSNSANSCYYICKSGYSGTNCETYSKFPGEDGVAGNSDDCDQNNITLANGQVWSACNLGATIAYSGSNAGTYNVSGSPTRGGDDSVNGKLYQWGRNKGFSSSDTSQLSTQLSSNPNSSDTFAFVWNSTLTNYDWLNPQINNIWGGSASDSDTLDGQTDKTLRKGPCPAGWHVPSAKEFQDACTSINNGTTCTNGMANTTVRTTLQLPYAGLRSRSTGLYFNQGTFGFYWSSSPSTTNGFNLNFNSSNVRPTTDSGRAYGFSVRCIKD